MEVHRGAFGTDLNTSKTDHFCGTVPFGTGPWHCSRSILLCWAASIFERLGGQTVMID